MVKKRIFSKISIFVDRGLLIPVVLLVSIGLLAILDVSAPKAMELFSDRFYFAKQQLKWALIGLGVYFLVSQIDVYIWNKYTLLIMGAAIVFLTVVLIPGIGTETLGARRWINFGFTNFQPSEFAKLAICLYMAKLADLKKSLPAYIVPIVLVAGLVMLQPDLGTTLVICMIAFVQLFFSGVNMIKLWLVAVVAVIAVGGLIMSSDYRRARVASFLDPMGGNELEENYHIRQVLYSLASGGLTGTGIGQSKQKYLFLPEATTDSIFAVIAEETGYLGVSIIIMLYGFVSFRMFRAIKKIKDPYVLVLAVGIFTWFVGQTFINLGSISSLIPFTGVPLPFISYGGSTLVSLLVALAIFNSVVKYTR